MTMPGGNRESTSLFGGNFAVVLESPSKKKYNPYTYEKYSASGKKLSKGKAITVDREASPLFFMEDEDGDGDDVDEEVERKARSMAGTGSSSVSKKAVPARAVQQPEKRGRGRPKKPSRQTSMTEFAGPTRLNKGKTETVDLISEDDNETKGKENVAVKIGSLPGNGRLTKSTSTATGTGKGTWEAVRLAAKDMRQKKQAKVINMFSLAQQSSPASTPAPKEDQLPNKKRKLSPVPAVSESSPLASSSSKLHRPSSIDADGSNNNLPRRSSIGKSREDSGEAPRSPARRKLIRGTELDLLVAKSKDIRRDEEISRSVSRSDLAKLTKIARKGSGVTKSSSSATGDERRGAGTNSFSSKKKAMEELRKRLKQKNASSSSKRALYDTSSDSSESSAEEVIERYDPTKMKKKNLDRDDAEFVVSDEQVSASSGDEESHGDSENENAHNLPSYDHQPGLMSYAKMKDEDVFRYVFHWVLFLCLDETFDPKTEYFMGPIRHLDRKLDTLRASRLESADWTSDFRQGLCRPHIKVKTLDYDYDNPHDYGCDACSRKNHMAICEITFQGTPYYSDTLQDVKKPGKDSRGMPIIPENVPFNAGRFCREKAVFAHMLRHWRKNLKEDLEKMLEEEGLLAPDVREMRAKMTKSERTMYVNNVLSSLEGMGKFGSCFLKFRKTMVKVENWIADKYK